MKVYLMRHGQADPGMSHGRYGLTPQGQNEVRAVAAKLKEFGVSVQYLWHSPKTRAEETAEIVRQVLGGRLLFEKKAGLMPEDSARDMAETLQDWALEHPSQNLMIVSHLPFLPSLVSLLLGDSFSFSGFSPASCMGLERSSRGSWSFDCFVDPLNLR